MSITGNNGRRQRRKELRRQEKREEKKRAEQMEQAKLEKAFNQNGDLDRGWMQEILQTDDLEELLDEYELRKIRGMLNRQWILGNLSEAQVHDRWYKLEVMKYKIMGEFPPEESCIQGPIRAFLYDDETERLTALSAEQRNAIDQIISSLQNMVTRTEGGFERKQVNTNIARTEKEQTETEDSGGRWGLFS